MPPAKILLIQLFSNGDCLYATAVARQIRHDYPGCHLTWAVSASCKNMILQNPDVDEIIEVSSVPKDNVRAFRKFLKNIRERQSQGEWDEVFNTHLMGINEANYDGSIRSAIFRGYGKPISVNVAPVLRLTEHEENNAKQFALSRGLNGIKNVILFEFAPLSGQAAITAADSIRIAELLTVSGDTAVILSSAKKVDHSNPRIIDGSALTIRETAALTHYCNFLIGCSSGITWISGSTAAKQLPMVQLLNPETNWINPPSRDFKRFGLDDSRIIELINFNVSQVADCVSLALVSFDKAKNRFNQLIPLHFRTTRTIVYNLLCYLELKAISKHIRINNELYGQRLSFYKEVIAGFLIFPFKLISNIFSKHL